ncbi:hypothetical protein BD289DRAFT_165987 [Coniella lustricola]|uniref:Uncharacterized protein n=1 Tax=Coniella lustricola TaxID=2025994 RepID=A0A2T2ZU50_9PEZI|nr:hypothetical protein BD289DRAFT_165987 [Coniella lustricola]
MSLARAFTTRRPKVFGNDGDSKMTRSNTVRNKISAPVELVHTTNMLSYNAPDIRKGPKISAPVELVHTTNMLSYDAPDIREPKTATSNSSMSLRFEGDSDRSPTAFSSPPTSPESAFPPERHNNTAKLAAAQEPNHLSCYFTLPDQPLPADIPDVPSLPARAPSHNKKPYEIISRKASVAERLGKKPSVSRLSEQSSRSVSSKASGSFSRSSSASTNTTASNPHSVNAYNMSKSAFKLPQATSNPTTSYRDFAPVQEPFGHELAQVTELAEEFAITAPEKTHLYATQEEQDLAARGLYKFSPEEYLSDIQTIFSSFFGEVRHVKNVAPQWI